MGTEALIGTQGSYTPFIHDVARPHRGQIESARIIHTLLEDSKFASQGEEKEMTIEEDYGTLRQDRYALRTAPQFMGPQLEDILSALDAVTQECNSSMYLRLLFRSLKAHFYPRSHGQPAHRRHDWECPPWW